MSFNFFQWIREGVKESVLMGVSDAVQHMGAPRPDDDVQQRLTAFLQVDGAARSAPRIAAPATRRKLGRTLEQIQASTSKPLLADSPQGK